MLRYAVPVDDQPHWFRLWSDPVRVETTDNPDKVEFWVEGYPDDDFTGALLRSFQVFDTGHSVPDDARWIGTTARYAGLVWHLYELTGETT